MISLLNINPSQLEFLFEADRELKSALNIRNVHDEIRAAFKIKTTNSELFTVTPPMGIVEPGTTKLVKVVFKAHRAYTDDLRFCKERFLIQSIVVDHTLAEHAISTNLFKSGQRQEAKLKILIAAPLAHGVVLENEIKDIAKRQGVEGHRAAARKFSELLLARGIISQAQVALAFSTVGELFQGMQGAKAVNGEDFLDGKTGLMTAPAPPTKPPPEPELGLGIPPSRRYDSARAESFRVVHPLLAQDLGLQPRLGSVHSFDDASYGRLNGTSGDSIINALSTGTELVSPPLRTHKTGPSTVYHEARSPVIGPAAVDDKAEVEENPKLWTAQRRFTYDDEAVQQAFPDDTFSHKLSNGADTLTHPGRDVSSSIPTESVPVYNPLYERDLDKGSERDMDSPTKRNAGDWSPITPPQKSTANSIFVSTRTESIDMASPGPVQADQTSFNHNSLGTAADRPEAQSRESDAAPLHAPAHAEEQALEDSRPAQALAPENHHGAHSPVASPMKEAMRLSHNSDGTPEASSSQAYEPKDSEPHASPGREGDQPEYEEEEPMHASASPDYEVEQPPPPANGLLLGYEADELSQILASQDQKAGVLGLDGSSGTRAAPESVMADTQISPAHEHESGLQQSVITDLQPSPGQEHQLGLQAAEPTHTSELGMPSNPSSASETVAQSPEDKGAKEVMFEDEPAQSQMSQAQVLPAVGSIPKAESGKPEAQSPVKIQASGPVRTASGNAFADFVKPQQRVIVPAMAEQIEAGANSTSPSKGVLRSPFEQSVGLKGPAERKSLDVQAETQADKVNGVISAKIVKAAQNDTLGRSVVTTHIDRLATPAIRKPSLPTPKRTESLTLPERNANPSIKLVSPAKVVSPAGRRDDKGHVFEPPDFSDLNIDVRDIDAERRAQEEGEGAAADAHHLVPIPSGNTMKMASYWVNRQSISS